MERYPIRQDITGMGRWDNTKIEVIYSSKNTKALTKFNKLTVMLG